MKISEKLKCLFEFIVAPLVVAIVLFLISNALTDRVMALEIRQEIYLQEITKINKKLNRIVCYLNKNDLTCEKDE